MKFRSLAVVPTATAQEVAQLQVRAQLRWKTSGTRLQGHATQEPRGAAELGTWFHHWGNLWHGLVEKTNERCPVSSVGDEMDV